MSDLEFVRISADGTEVVVRDDTGREFAMSMDDRAAAALIPRSSPADSPGALTPREIQSRIRAGADVAGLAAQTGTSEERILAFAVPILQERAHIANRARATLVRRASGVGTLEDIVVARLHPLGVLLADTHWDARRMDDGRWEVRVSYASKDGARQASWIFDAKAAVLAPSDDEAHWLMGEPPVAPTRAHATKPTLPVFHTDNRADADVDNVVPLKRRKVAAPADSDAAHDVDTERPEPVRPKSPKGRRPIPSWDEILFGAPTDSE